LKHPAKKSSKSKKTLTQQVGVSKNSEDCNDFEITEISDPDVNEIQFFCLSFIYTHLFSSIFVCSPQSSPREKEKALENDFDDENSDASCELLGQSDSEVGSSDESCIDKELLEGVSGFSRARQESRQRSMPKSDEGSNSFQRNMLRQFEAQSKTFEAVATALTSVSQSKTSSVIKTNGDLINEIRSIKEAKDAGVYDDAEAAEQIAQAKAALKKYQSIMNE